MFGRRGDRILKRDLFMAPHRRLSDTARAALLDAAKRRRVFDPASLRAEDAAAPRAEPTRYGDWESGGRCSDF